ncbi:YqjK-like family protein [Halomonas nitroreducens]|uniref:YqjK-like family protein n=1 Tax=Halomonas nitroreducens TaxID=447425 RepID=UPI00163B01FE|nr:YqjK-like family protein [Halomonas nitroreducens]
MTRNAEPSRHERKAVLEATIEQQRVDLLVATDRWQAAAHPLDAGWQAVHRYRVPILVAGGLLLLPVARHPGSVTRLGRKALVGALALDRLRRLLTRFR